MIKLCRTRLVFELFLYLFHCDKMYMTEMFSLLENICKGVLEYVVVTSILPNSFFRRLYGHSLRLALFYSPTHRRDAIIGPFLMIPF